MAKSVNKVILLGNVGRDPEIKVIGNGTKVANFSIACTESWKDQSGQRQEKTEWVNCVAWRGTAELVEKYVKKGDKLYLEGKLQTRSWDDTNGGGKRYATEVVVSEVVFAGGNQGGQGGRGGHGGDDLGELAGNGGFTPAGADDDLPF